MFLPAATDHCTHNVKVRQLPLPLGSVSYLVVQPVASDRETSFPKLEPSHRVAARINPPPEKKRYLPLGWQAKSGYGFLAAVLDELEALPTVQAFLDSILHTRCKARPGYPPSAMFRVVCLKYLLAERFNVGLIHRFKASPRLAEICEFTTSIPSEPTFSWFFNKLADVPLEDAIVEVVEKLREKLPDIGDDVAVDSTDVEAWANPKRDPDTDPDAEWGHRTRKAKSWGTNKKKDELFFGYKVHALADSVYGVPLAHLVLPANLNDFPQLHLMVQKAQKLYPWFKPRHLIADRGYEGNPNSAFLYGEGINPIIHVKKPTASDGLYDGIYTKKGIPVCGDGKVPMEYIRTDPETGNHLFTCPTSGCALKSENPLMNYCVPEIHAEDPRDNLRVMGLVGRWTQEWKDLYSRRTIIERYFGSAKRMRLLDKHQYLQKRKIEMHVNLSTLTYLGTMLGRALAGDLNRIRHMRVW